MPPIDYKTKIYYDPNLAKRLGRGFEEGYYVETGGAPSPVSKEDIQSVFGLSSEEIQTRAYTGTIGGVRGRTAADLKSTLESQFQQSLPFISSFTQADIKKPENVYIQKDGGKQLIPRASLEDWRSLGWKEISPLAAPAAPGAETPYQKYFREQQALGKSPAEISQSWAVQQTPVAPTDGIVIPTGEAAVGKQVTIGGKLYPSQEWYDVNVLGKKEATGQPEEPVVPPGGGVGAPPPGGGEVIEEPNVKTLSFNLDDLITGEFDTDDLINIFASPITGMDIDKLLKENMDLRQKFLDSLDPSDEEIQLKSDLVELRGEIQTKQLEFKKGVADIQQELVSTRVMVGKEQALFTQAQLGMQTLAIQESNLLMRLGLEQEAREASSRVIAATLEFNEADLNRMQTMQTQIWNQKMDLYNMTSQLSIRAQNTLNLVLSGLTGLDPGDLDSETVTKLQALTKSAGIPWSIVQQAMKVNKDEYEYNRYMGDLDRQLMEAKLEGGGVQDFTDSQKLQLEQAGIDWTNPVGRQQALDFLFKEGPENVEEMMTQYKDLVQQYKDNNFSKEDAESMVRSENNIKEDEDIPGPYQDIIDEIYEGKITKTEGGWVEWLKKAAAFVFQPWTGFPQIK